MKRSLLVILLLLVFSPLGRASHVLGGEITWTCQGGDYVFELVFYRDCNGAVFNPVNETIDVWGHPTVTQFNVNYISNTDISPTCTEVAGGPAALVCGVGQSGGNGIGAIEKVIYRSAPITLSGVPPSEGWVFTYQNSFRTNDLINISNPSTQGMTLTSKMYASSSNTGCVDNSPQFLQDPYFVSCAGDPYEYNMNAVDPDLDSLAISFSTPLNNFSGAYNPPTSPASVSFESGFSFNSPTPDASFNPGNVAATVDPSSGNLTFLSNNIGSYAVKIVAKSYRNGILISEVDREMQMTVKICGGLNNQPTILGPFGGLFETTINAGDLVNFNLSSTDIELLQDGTPQSNLLSASGLQFGTNYTSTTGCANAPCATLDATPIIIGTQGVNTTFNWQTTCDHLVNPLGFVADEIPYHFVFKVQDDYCPVPKVQYATITINVLNPGVIPATQINCIQSDLTGDVSISWDAVTDPLGTFSEYQIHSLQSGLLASIPTIGTTSYVDPGVSQQNDYFIVVASGCNGNTLKYSDTISNIFLDLNNPSNGTAVLQWNDPIDPPLASMNSFYHIYREYPVIGWSLYDSVPYGTTFYLDTIDICDTYLNYQIVLPNDPCNFSSNIEGDQFEDMLTPDIPVIESVTVDTMTNNIVITWNENSQEDTYGYIIYSLDANGFLVEIDTVWGLTNTEYIHNVNVNNGPLTYSVAAFDSCWTAAIPPTYQTSAKAPIHTSIFVVSTLDVCTRQVTLNWSDYVGWSDLDHYIVHGKVDGGNWTVMGTSTLSELTIDVQGELNYCFTIEAVSATGIQSFSNRTCLYIGSPTAPAINYLKVATVSNNEVVLRHFIDLSTNIKELSIQRMDDLGNFAEIDRIIPSSTNITYIDNTVDVHEASYIYRIQAVDSCSQLGIISNQATSILAKVQTDDVAKINYLNWNPYSEFNGSILGYNIYRGVDEIFDPVPIASLGPNARSFQEDINAIISTGKICYYIEAIESMNIYSFSEISRSNITCSVLPPIIYIPNSFTPDGDEFNDVFNAVVSDFLPESFEMIIFDRMGHAIFSTNNHDEGWNGIITRSGKLAQVGMYPYLISVQDANGVEIVKRGHVTLLK
ncbi:MAG: gliding motility-associated C-terminal domain-containing protein [Crocinitomicaceae bacterium]|nr:gliding motility-associated C-terminal domain-containing protein [Crocinitomicaceae bacterium]